MSGGDLEMSVMFLEDVKGCWKKNLPVLYFDILMGKLGIFTRIFDFEQKSKIGYIGLIWQNVKFHKDPLKN